MSDKKFPLNAGKLGVLINPNLKDPKEGKSHGPFDYVRAFLTCPEKKLGDGFTRRMSFVRGTVWDLAFFLYGLLDAGKDKDAWGVSFSILCQYGKAETARTEAYHEIKRRHEAGDDQARKLLDYASVSGVAVIWIKWSESTGKVRLETFSEAAERHLRAICMLKNEELAGSYRNFRQSMVDHKFFDMARGIVVTTAARKAREEAVKRAASAKAEAVAKKPVVAVGLHGLEGALAEKNAKDEAAAKKKAEEDKKKAKKKE